MGDKPILHYINGRGRMECIRWMLAACDVEFTEQFLEKKEDFQKLIKSGDLMFQQVPMVEIDGMKLVQTGAIMSYIAGKYNMYGKDLKERAYIDMLVGGITDLMTMILSFFFTPEEEKEKLKNLIKEKALNRYLPVFNNTLKNNDFLVGTQLSMADVQLLYAIYSLQEFHCDILQNFPKLQAFKERTSAIPPIKKFLQPGSQRKPMADEKYVNIVKTVFLG